MNTSVFFCQNHGWGLFCNFKHTLVNLWGGGFITLECSWRYWAEYWLWILICCAVGWRRADPTDLWRIIQPNFRNDSERWSLFPYRGQVSWVQKSYVKRELKHEKSNGEVHHLSAPYRRSKQNWIEVFNQFPLETYIYCWSLIPVPFGAASSTYIIFFTCAVCMQSVAVCIHRKPPQLKPSYFAQLFGDLQRTRAGLVKEKDGKDI